MLGVVAQQRACEREDLPDALIGEPVVDRAVLTGGRHETAPAQTRELIRHVGLAGLERFHELADRALPLAKQLEDPQPRPPSAASRPAR